MKIIELLSDTKFMNKNVLEKLICYYLWITREKLFLNIEKTISSDVLDKIYSSYDDYTIRKKPLEYILWFVEFLWLKFEVNQHTLIPRPETEYMIQSINEYVNKNPNDYSLVDIGTGCGVLWLSVNYFNDKHIYKTYLTDITDEALSVANLNYEKYRDNISNDVIIKKENLWNLANQKYFDPKDLDNMILVSNLPYIPDDVFDNNVEENVKKWEPKFAFVGWDDGCDLYREMFDQIIETKKKLWNDFELIMFLEMMDWQVDILDKEYWNNFVFEKVKTFHFNIKIVRARFKE